MGQWHYMLLLAVEKVLQFMISLVIASFVFKTKSSSFCAVAGISMNWIFHLTLTKKVMMTIMTKKIPGQRSRSWSWWWSVNIFHLPELSLNSKMQSFRWSIRADDILKGLKETQSSSISCHPKEQKDLRTSQ